MSGYKVLCLTDPTNHTIENSVYTLLNGFHRHDRCQQVDVASRALPINNPFFDDHNFDQIHVTNVDSAFHFDTANSIFSAEQMMVSPKAYDFIFLRLPRASFR